MFDHHSFNTSPTAGVKEPLIVVKSQTPTDLNLHVNAERGWGSRVSHAALKGVTPSFRGPQLAILGSPEQHINVTC